MPCSSLRHGMTTVILRFLYIVYRQSLLEPVSERPAPLDGHFQQKIQPVWTLSRLELENDLGFGIRTQELRLFHDVELAVRPNAGNLRFHGAVIADDHRQRLAGFNRTVWWIPPEGDWGEHCASNDEPALHDSSAIPNSNRKGQIERTFPTFRVHEQNDVIRLRSDLIA